MALQVKLAPRVPLVPMVQLVLPALLERPVRTAAVGLWVS
jgi:hypothetical protein